MSKPLLSAAACSLFLAACTPPEPVPPPRFTPNPPNAPTPVDPYGNPVQAPATQPDPYASPAPTSPPPAPGPGEYPTASPSGKPGLVISPYEPYEEIDVAGYESGQLVRDPRNRKIFRVP